MTDNEFTLFIFLGLATLFAIYQRLVIRNLRKKIEDMAAASVAASAKTAETIEGPATKELEKLRQRVQVLERIATDGSQSLDRELESLR